MAIIQFSEEKEKKKKESQFTKINTFQLRYKY